MSKIKARGMADSSEAGRNNSCTTEENEKGVSVKLSHCILKNTCITFTVLSNRLVNKKRQRFITGPVPHESCKSKEGGKTSLPISGVKTFNGCKHVNCL